MLRNAVGVSNFPEKSVTNVYGSTLLAYQRVAVVKFPIKTITKVYGSTLLAFREGGLVSHF